MSLSPTTMPFDTIDGLELHADVYAPPRAADTGVLVWLHGGALSLGHRSAVPSFVLDAAEAHGFLVVSPDYRLAPHVGLEAILRDVHTAVSWTRQHATARGHDAARLMIAGESAGGYLSLATATSSDACAVVSFYGYGTLDSPWYLEPYEHYRHAHPLITESEAFAVVGTDVTTDGRDPSDRYKFYLYCRQAGRWPELTAGFDRVAERDCLRASSPAYAISGAHPPALLIHGAIDSDVPVAESIAYAALLDLHRVDHELMVLEGVDHGFVGPPGPVPPPPPEAIAPALERAESFMNVHLGPR